MQYRFRWSRSIYVLKLFDLIVISAFCSKDLNDSEVVFSIDDFSNEKCLLFDSTINSSESTYRGVFNVIKMFWDIGILILLLDESDLLFFEFF